MRGSNIQARDGICARETNNRSHPPTAHQVYIPYIRKRIRVVDRFDEEVEDALILIVI